jgi:hypothetical protein
VRLHPLNAHQVVDQLQEGRQLQQLEDPSDLGLLIRIESGKGRHRAVVENSVEDK